MKLICGFFLFSCETIIFKNAEFFSHSKKFLFLVSKHTSKKSSISCFIKFSIFNWSQEDLNWTFDSFFNIDFPKSSSLSLFIPLLLLLLSFIILSFILFSSLISFVFFFNKLTTLFPKLLFSFSLLIASCNAIRANNCLIKLGFFNFFLIKLCSVKYDTKSFKYSFWLFSILLLWYWLILSLSFWNECNDPIKL